MVYKSKTQSLTAGSSTEAEFIVVHVAAKITYEQKSPTPIHIDNMSALQIINNNISPTEQTRHLDIRYFAIQDWRETGDIIMEHIPGILNPNNNRAKPFGYVLYA